MGLEEGALNWNVSSLLLSASVALVLLGKGARGILPTHPNKGTNYFNYGVIAESCVN